MVTKIGGNELDRNRIKRNTKTNRIKKTGENVRPNE
jgi:hypothetical protein